ncbi:hypothetical protein F4604DRAFT_1197067 [Suillus subluteus]|nr:hypothetical protein F4604DRAFT_1197067 [Suillus subluteus]
MSEQDQSRNSGKNPPPENRAPSEAAAGESSGGRRGKIRRFLGKVKNVTKKISHSKGSRGRDPVLPNVDRGGASSIEDTTSGVERRADPKSALEDAIEAVKDMNLLSGPVTSAVSAAQMHQRNSKTYIICRPHISNLSGYSTSLSRSLQMCIHTQRLH